jgi:hypothetical protein
VYPWKLKKKSAKIFQERIVNKYQYKHQEKYVRVFPNRIALQFLSNNVQLSRFNNVLKYQCSSVPKYQENKKLNSARVFLEKCVNQFHNRNVELSQKKPVRILFANLSFGVNNVLVHQLLNHPMEVPVVHHLYQSLQEILFQHHRTLMAPHKVLL